MFNELFRRALKANRADCSSRWFLVLTLGTFLCMVVHEVYKIVKFVVLTAVKVFLLLLKFAIVIVFKIVGVSFVIFMITTVLVDIALAIIRIPNKPLKILCS